MTTGSWTELHDATLESVELRWLSGEAVMRIRTGDAMHPRRVIVASAVRRLVCDRQMPWEPSASIHDVRGPATLGDGASVLEIEVQSGDVLRIEAVTFSVRDAE